MSCTDFKMPHGATEPVLNYGGERIAEQCKVCHCPAAVYQECASCAKFGKLTELKGTRGGPKWFCDEDCKANWETKKRAEPAATKIAKEEAAKKKARGGAIHQ